MTKVATLTTQSAVRRLQNLVPRVGNHFISDTPYLTANDVVMKERSEVETDPNFQQPLPYVVVTDGLRILTYRRKGGEERLSGLKSIGIGGHVEEEDTLPSNNGDVIAVAARRELEEEIGQCHGELTRIGVIVENDNLVAAIKGGDLVLKDVADLKVQDVHIGILFIYLTEPDILDAVYNALLSGKSTATDPIYRPGLMTFQETLADIDDFEGWSKIAITELTR